MASITSYYRFYGDVTNRSMNFKVQGLESFPIFQSNEKKSEISCIFHSTLAHSDSQQTRLTLNRTFSLFVVQCRFVRLLFVIDVQAAMVNIIQRKKGIQVIN